MQNSASVASESKRKPIIFQVAKPKTSVLSLVFFCTGGLSSLFVFNCFISMEPYWKERYGPSTLRYILFAMNIGGIAGFLTYRPASRFLRLKWQAILLPPLSFFCSLGSYALGELLPEESLAKSLAINAAAFVVGLSGSFLQNCFTQMCFSFGDAEIASMNSGMGLAGVLTALIALLQAAYLPSQSTSESALYYISFQAFIVVWILGVCLRFYAMQKRLAAKLSAIKAEKSSELSTKLLTDSSPNTSIKLAPSLGSTFKLIYPLVISLFCNFLISMSIFPTISLGLSLGWEGPTEVQVTILNYNVLDLIGKALFAVMPLYSHGANHSVVLLRFLHNVFAAYVFGGVAANQADITGDWRVSLGFTAVLGIFGGYLNSSLLAAAARKASGPHGNNAAYLMVLAIMSGLLYGSGVNVFCISDK